MLVIGASSSDDEAPPARFSPPPEVVPPAPRVPSAAVRRLWSIHFCQMIGQLQWSDSPFYRAHIQDPGANDLHDLDLDAAYITMLTLDLLALFGIMACPACHRIHVRDPSEFLDWLHVISDLIVVKMFANSNDEEMEAFKASVVDTLRTKFGITLTCATNSCTLSTSQVTVPVASMSEAMSTLGVRLCMVIFFGMKWSILSVKPSIDNFIRRYYA